MSSAGKTGRLLLSQFQGTDKPSWLADYNADMVAIDSFAGTGWIPLPTCTRASLTSFNISGDWSSILSVGDKIKLTQSGTIKYFYVVVVMISNGVTTVVVAGGSDFSLADTAISASYFSKAATPVGFPGWFNYSPTYGASGSMTFTSVTTNFAKFRIVGRNIEYRIWASGTTGGTASNQLISSLPVVPSSSSDLCPFSGFFSDGGGYMTTAGFANMNGSGIYVMKYDVNNFGLGSGRMFNICGGYPL